MLHFWLSGCPAFVRTVLDVEGLDGSMFDLRPVFLEVRSEVGGASGIDVSLDRLEELFLSDELLE